MRWYDAHGVEAVDYGLVSMRRHGGGAIPDRIRLDELPGRWDGADGSAIVDAFALHDWLAQTDDAALLATPLRTAADTRLSRELIAVGGEWVPVSARLRREQGVGDPGGIDPHGERIVARCDGATPLRDLVEETASLLEVDSATIVDGVLAAVRRLVERGILRP
jgi:hypothetical protein